MDEIVEKMQNPNISEENRHTGMVYIKRIRPKKKIFKKALKVLETSNSLPTCAAFMGVLSAISESKADFLDFEGWIKICQGELEKNN